MDQKISRDLAKSFPQLYTQSQPGPPFQISPRAASVSKLIFQQRAILDPTVNQSSATGPVQ